MKIKIGWFSDSHIDYNQYGLADRREDFAIALCSTVDDMITAGVHAIIHSGDIANSNRPSSSAVICLQTLHRHLIENKMFMYTVSGNHDFSTPSWLEVLEPHADGGIVLIDRKKVVVGDIVISGYESMSRNDLIDCFAKDDLSDVDILILHQMVKDFVGFPPPGALELADIPKTFQFVALGDVHVYDIRRMVLTESFIGYTGSSEMCSTSEDEVKYWTDINFENGKLMSYGKNIIRTRPVIRWSVNSEEGMLNALAKVPELEKGLQASGEFRKPMFLVTFPTTVPGIVHMLHQHLDPNKYIIRPIPEFSVQQEGVPVTFQGDLDESMSIQDILRQQVMENDGLFQIASQLLNPDIDGKTALDQFCETRMKELDAAQAV